MFLKDWTETGASVMPTRPKALRRDEGETPPVRPEPNPALKRLAGLVGVWKLEGRTSVPKHEWIRGRVSIEWLPGGFFMIQQGWIRLGRFKARSMEIIGYDPQTDTFPSYVYSDLGGVPSRYCWNVKGKVVEHWTEGAKYTGRFSEDGGRLSGGWRHAKGAQGTPTNTYDATMIRVR